jgi:hypothetical protein
MRENRHIPNLLFSLVVTVLIVAFTWCVAGAASDIRVEAESFENYGSYNIGGYDIEEAFCSYASGQLAVDGLDVPGEWFKLKVTFEVSGCYGTSVAYQSDYGDTVQLAVRILDYPDIGDELVSQYELSGGYGYG